MSVFRLTGKPSEVRAFWAFALGSICVLSACHDLGQQVDATPGGSGGVAGLAGTTPAGGTAAAGAGRTDIGEGGLDIGTNAAGDADGGATNDTAGGAKMRGVGGTGGKQPLASDAGAPEMQAPLVVPSWITWLSSDLI